MGRITMIKTVSQSFIKDFSDYLDGTECGIVINEKYVNDRLLDDPDAEPGARELGSYFEFVAFGALPKSGIIPMPVMMASGKGMTAEYRLATINAKRVREILTEELGLKILDVGVRKTKSVFHGNDEITYSGVIDLVVECTKRVAFDTGVNWEVGDIFVIDLKYSGLIGDTTPGWNKHGWRFTEPQKKYHGTQAKQYHFLTDLPFYFLVCQSNNKEGTLSDIKFFHVAVTPFQVEQHIKTGNALFEKFGVMAQIGFTPRPSLKKCGKCPLREECTVKHVYPHPEIINLDDAA